MLFDRKIKYVDYCENGERIRGGGFVKLEVRDGFLNMDLHIKGLYPTDSFVRDVVISGSDMEAVLGQITLQEGMGCFSYSCEMIQGIGSTGISYEDLREIKIPVGGSRELCCTWEKIVNKAAIPAKPLGTEALDRESPEPESAESESSKPEGMSQVSLITRDEGVGIQETKGQGTEIQETEGQGTEVQGIATQETEVQETEVQEGEANGTEIQEATVQETFSQQPMVQEPIAREAAVQELAVQEAIASEPTAQEEFQPTETQPTESQTAEFQQPETLGSGFQRAMSTVSVTERQDPTSQGINQRSDKTALGPQVSGDSGQQENKNKLEQKSAVKLLEDKWQQLSAIYPHIRPFNDEREYLSLSPSDFVLFPESYYRAANNSFLLHGFYNYKHLILARVERRSEVRYYLGVPGNYYEREKQVAVMFGFESFECDREPAKTGDFGYYLMRMEL